MSMLPPAVKAADHNIIGAARSFRARTQKPGIASVRTRTDWLIALAMAAPYLFGILLATLLTLLG